MPSNHFIIAVITLDLLQACDQPKARDFRNRLTSLVESHRACPLVQTLIIAVDQPLIPSYLFRRVPNHYYNPSSCLSC